MSVTGVKMESQRKEYGRALVEMGSSNRDIVVLDADLSVSTRTGEFGKVFPDRFFNCGVSEANMICVAAGLAMAGKTAFASTFAVFATGLTYNQIRQSVAYPASNVKIAASHAGLSVGPDGATHQMLEDIGLMRGLPNMTVIVPADAKETYQATYALAEMKGPAYMRFGRADVPSVSDVNGDFRIGKASVLKNGSDVTIVATGQLVHSSIQAAAELSDRGVDAEVINMSTIKPIDTGTLIASARRTGCIVTAEEHSVINGLGDAVCSVVSASYPVPVAKVGTEDTFGESGEAGELLVKYGLTPGRIVDRALKLVAGRK
ncbi:MAG: transketolase family protein [Thermoplasmata archaeon]|uniref:Transketolase family protein n=1 Tax=Candidatus Sysuiplasma superficiale TaxID=2823368 RepID=A0A8J7YME9_9ARCH|nr:transketolase family protein [Candidatus Sysuiplasma superficiale]